MPHASPLAHPAPEPSAQSDPGDAQSLRLLRAVADLAAQGAAGRAGISTLLAEIERRHPGEIARMAATLELRRLGVGEFRVSSPNAPSPLAGEGGPEGRMRGETPLFAG